MITFVIACAGLILFSGLFYLFPRRGRFGSQQDLEEANREWYRLRKSELEASSSSELEDDIQLRLLEDAQQARQQGSLSESQSFPVWLLLPVIGLMATGLYYYLGAAADVRINEQLQTVDANSDPADMEALIEAVQERSAQRPGNLHYVALLGRYYMGQGDYSRAAGTYSALAEQAPEDAQALAYAAQAEFLAADRQLSDSARVLAERALAINPHQRTALGLLGMASFEQGQYRAAIEYWERLLAMETPGSQSATMIAGVIERARASLGEVAQSAAASPAVEPLEAGSHNAGVTVSIRMPQGANFTAADTVFVLARNAASDSRMPIAVQRLSAGQLPLTLRLDDSNSMAGQKLSDADEVLVIVQVSPDGRPGEAGATFLGQAGPLVPGDSKTAVEIELSANSG
ncbi:MAG: c-type cytochrome biogenesis protein CcmI [Halioglobus sp.]